MTATGRRTCGWKCSAMSPFFCFYFISFVDGVYFQDVPSGMALFLSLLSKLDAIRLAVFDLDFGFECLSRRQTSCA